jgi:hypothetical protein
MTVGKRIEKVLLSPPLEVDDSGEKNRKRWGKKEREGGVPDGWYGESPPPLFVAAVGVGAGGCCHCSGWPVMWLLDLVWVGWLAMEQEWGCWRWCCSRNSDAGCNDRCSMGKVSHEDKALAVVINGARWR